MCLDKQGEAVVHWSHKHGERPSLRNQANQEPCVKALDWEIVNVVPVLLLLPEFERVSKSFSASVHNGVIIFSCLSVGHCYLDIVLMGTTEQTTIY